MHIKGPQIGGRFEKKNLKAETRPARSDWDFEYAERTSKFTPDQLAQTKHEVEEIWRSFGIPLEFDWNKVELRQTVQPEEKGKKLIKSSFDQRGEQLIINIPHYTLFWGLPAQTREEMRLRLRHEAIHTSGYNAVEEEVSDQTYKGRPIYKRVQHSGLYTFIQETNEYGVLQERASFHLLNEGFTSTANKDKGAKKSQALFRLIVQELAKQNFEGKPLDEAEVLKLVAHSYRYGWDPKLAGLIKSRWGETGYTILERLSSDYHEKFGDTPEKDLYYNFFAGHEDFGKRSGLRITTAEQVLKILDSSLKSFSRGDSIF